MQDSSNNDVNLNVLGTGCATSCGASCVALLLSFVILAIVGVQAVRQGFALPLLGFLVGLLVHLTVGYVTAKAARAHNAAINFHVILVGALTMLLGLLAWIFPQKNHLLSSQTQSLVHLFQIMSWLLTIPLMLLGASWSDDGLENPSNNDTSP